MDEVMKLMVEQLRDAYSAEKQGLRAMPRLARKATAQSLKDMLQMHVEQTEGQVERLEQALEKMGARPGRKVCEGMRGIIEEGQHELEEHDKGPLLDQEPANQRDLRARPPHRAARVLPGRLPQAHLRRRRAVAGRPRRLGRRLLSMRPEIVFGSAI